MDDRTLTLEDLGAARTSASGAGPALCRVLSCDDLALPPLWVPLGDEVLELSRGQGGLSRVDEGGSPRQQLLVDDHRASRPHARLQRAAGGAELLDLGSKNGTTVDGQPAQRARLRDGALIEVGRTLFRFRAAVDLGRVHALPATLSAPKLPPLATASPELAALFAILERVAPSTVPALLLGETGTGKEVFARRLHALSRRSGAFVAVNCGALPGELIEAELFGARRGAFSGAVSERPGLVRAAAGGTLFLDEVGDLPLPSQAALLRVLQEKEVVPVGGTEPVAVDFRLVAATHRDLDAMVKHGSYRADLRARLAGVTLTLPPLRERREDLGLLLRGFAAEQGRSVRLSVPAARLLLSAFFPGNVRELQRAVEGALARAAGTGDPTGPVVLEPEHFPDLVEEQDRDQDEGPNASDNALDPPPGSAPDDELGRQRVALLQEHKGNVSAVARVLGKKRMQVYRWITRYGLDPERFR
ncbi:MAG: sigma 54-interacting transcriptional regulator [Deltaproteobacteria bacterium]|nr:sigma 54-interacting transcriptional regulator [Deltaproteobacteria bacterium]